MPKYIFEKEDEQETVVSPLKEHIVYFLWVAVWVQQRERMEVNIRPVGNLRFWITSTLLFLAGYVTPLDMIFSLGISKAEWN